MYSRTGHSGIPLMNRKREKLPSIRELLGYEAKPQKAQKIKPKLLTRTNLRKSKLNKLHLRDTMANTREWIDSITTLIYEDRSLTTVNTVIIPPELRPHDTEE